MSDITLDEQQMQAVVNLIQYTPAMIAEVIEAVNYVRSDIPASDRNEGEGLPVSVLYDNITSRTPDDEQQPL